MNLIGELTKELKGETITLQEMEYIIYSTDLVNKIDLIYDKEVLDEQVIAYPLITEEEINNPRYLYIEFDFLERNEEEPWKSEIVIEDMYIM